jgi:hypothetical protein
MHEPLIIRVMCTLLCLFSVTNWDSSMSQFLCTHKNQRRKITVNNCTKRRTERYGTSTPCLLLSCWLFEKIWSYAGCLRAASSIWCFLLAISQTHDLHSCRSWRDTCRCPGASRACSVSTSCSAAWCMMREEKQMSNTHASRSRGVQFGVKITDIERGNEGRGEAYQCRTSSSVELPRGAIFGRLPGGQQSHPPVGPQLRPRRSLGERTPQQDGRAAAPWAWEGLAKLGSCGVLVFPSPDRLHLHVG